MSALSPNPEAAVLFSHHLHDDAPTEYRLIHPVTYHVLSIWGTPETLPDSLTAYNVQGYGVFALVNTPQLEVQARAAAGKSARDRDIAAITALFVELDREEPRPGENLSALQSAPLIPTLIVRSSKAHKLHAYWRVSGMSVGEFKLLQAALIARFRGDPACKNPARVMRLPGYLHTKGTPLITTILEHSDRRYSREEMFAAFPELPEALEQERKRKEARAQSIAQVSSWRKGSGKPPGHARHYALAALQSEQDRVANAAEGTRNTTLNAASFSLGQLVGGELLSHDEVEEVLSAAALACGLDEDEITRTVASGIQAGLQTPRAAPTNRPPKPTSRRARLAGWYR